MTKRALTILVIALLLVGGTTAAIATTIGGSDGSSVTHVMPNGMTMNDDGMHTMADGETMSGSQMDK